MLDIVSTTHFQMMLCCCCGSDGSQSVVVSGLELLKLLDTNLLVLRALI